MKKFLGLVISVVALAATPSAFAGDYTCKNIVKVDSSDVVVKTTSQYGDAQIYTTSEGKPVTVNTSMSGSYCAD